MRRKDKCAEHRVYTAKTSTMYVGGECIECGDTVHLTGLVPDTRFMHPFPQGGKHARTTTK